MEGRDNGKTVKTSPQLPCFRFSKRGAKAIDFYKAAFSAQEIFRLDDDNGSVRLYLSVRQCRFSGSLTNHRKTLTSALNRSAGDRCEW